MVFVGSVDCLLFCFTSYFVCTQSSNNFKRAIGRYRISVRLQPAVVSGRTSGKPQQPNRQRHLLILCLQNYKTSLDRASHEVEKVIISVIWIGLETARVKCRNQVSQSRQLRVKRVFFRLLSRNFDNRLSCAHVEIHKVRRQVFDIYRGCPLSLCRIN